MSTSLGQAICTLVGSARAPCTVVVAVVVIAVIAVTVVAVAVIGVERSSCTLIGADKAIKLFERRTTLFLKRSSHLFLSCYVSVLEECLVVKFYLHFNTKQLNY